MASIVSTQGLVQFKAPGQADWSEAGENDLLCGDDLLYAGPDSGALVRFVADETLMRIDQETTLVLAPVEEASSTFLDILEGTLFLLMRQTRTLEVRTPFVNGVVDGTEFAVEVRYDVPAGQRQAQGYGGSAQIIMLDGTLTAQGGGQSSALQSGQTAIAVGQCAPLASEDGLPQCQTEELRELVEVRATPQDKTQWALHYQPTLLRLGDSGAAEIPDVLAPALGVYDPRDPRAALEVLGQDIDAADDPAALSTLLVSRAGLRLAVGQLPGAQEDLARIADLGPGDTPEQLAAASEARSLEAIIALTTGIGEDAEQRALALAEEGVALADRAEATGAPRPAAADIALSYAQQASGQLELARETMERSVAANPDNGLAQARLSELWQSFGRQDQALEAGDAAVEAAPGLARARIVRGFSHLSTMRFDESRADFDAAIQRDPNEPLGWFGLGLLEIRKGNLETGREYLWHAVGLDPGNALFRAYLGKAYYEERREDLAKEQLEISKTLDPADPTPWFYDVFVLQSQNQPVMALEAIEESIARNDNRSVYRGQQLLDSDRAARDARLAEVYRNLGFDELAILQGTRSVEVDPSDYSAHRLLSDSYRSLPRHEIASDSELLQYQLLQPLNLNPVRPRLADNGLSFLDNAGPASVSFNEFTPLFESNGIQLRGDAFAGNNETFGDDLVLSGVYDNVAFSFGQFLFDSDGIRENNEINQQIYNAFGQVELSPQVSLIAEVRSELLNQGDRDLFFDPNAFNPLLDDETDFWSARLGGRYEHQPGVVTLASFIHGDVDSDREFGLFRTVEEQESDLFEVRQIVEGEKYNLNAGFGIARSEGTISTTSLIIPDSVQNIDADHDNAYLYANVKPVEDVVVTVGASVDRFEDVTVDTTQFNPKLGATWDVTQNTTVRVAGFRTLKRTLISSQTLEPTSVAGFNQFFDDINGADAWNYGLGVDQRATKNLYFGGDVFVRDLDVPFLQLGGGTGEQNWDDLTARAYVYWTPTKKIAVSAEYQFTRIERDALGQNVDRVAETDIHKVPVAITYFDESGFFARAGATFVHQNGDFLDANSMLFSDSDEAVVLDAALGWRLPKGRGEVSVGFQNMLDSDFRFQDVDPGNPSLLPEQTFLARLTLNF